MTPPVPPDDPLRELLSDLESPAPPPGLRSRVLARAAAALARGPAPDPWRRIWESRPLRLGWALAVLLLAGANLLLPARPGRPAAVASVAPAAGDPDLAAAQRLPRLRAELASAGAGPAVSSPSAAPAPVPPVLEKGSSS